MSRSKYHLVHGAHGHIAAPFELQDGCQFYACEVLQHDQDGLFIHAVLNIRVAFIARDQDQAEAFDLMPEGLIIHRLQVILNVVYMAEFNHGFSISERIQLAQILRSSSPEPKEPSHV